MDLSAHTRAYPAPDFTSMNRTASPVSLNEIGFYFTRAAVGAGAPFGVAEEFARASAWLAYLGLDPARCAVPSLHALAGGASNGALCVDEGHEATRIRSRDGRPACAIHAGPVVADRLAIEAGGGSECLLVLAQTDQPVLIAAAIAAAEIDANPIRIAWPSPDGGRIVVELTEGTVELTVRDGTDPAASGPAEVEIALNRPAGVSEPPARPPRSEATLLAAGKQRAARLGVTVDESAWSEVIRFFRKCLVPSTARSRSSGAGAGSIDNA